MPPLSEQDVLDRVRNNEGIQAQLRDSAASVAAGVKPMPWKRVRAEAAAASMVARLRQSNDAYVAAGGVPHVTEAQYQKAEREVAKQLMRLC